MSNVRGIVETEEVVKVETTLVRRVSNMLKDGNSEPPMLFSQSSMQKIRHCCQNLNLFPYLLYSFDNSKSHPIAQKVHLCFGHFLEGITSRVLFLYKTFRQTVRRRLLAEKPCEGISQLLENEEETKQREDKEEEKEEEEEQEQEEERNEKPLPRFCNLEREKRKQIPLFLTLAVYLTPLLLMIQCIGLFSLMMFGKYTPGFIFLITALLLLGCISLKITFHETMVHTVKCEKSKVH